MKKQQKNIIIVLIVFLTLAALFAANKNIFHYEFLYSKPVTYSADEYSKADYILEEYILKPGNYTFSFLGKMTGKKSSVYLVDQDQEKLISAEFIDGETEYSEDFTIGKIEKVRLGVSYDPEFGELEIDRISIASDKVIYKDQIIRHAVISVFIVILAVIITAAFLKGAIRPALLWVLLFTVVICLPYFSKDYFWGDDLFFHLSRIEGMAETIKAGYFPARNQLFWLQDYGYGTGFFYPDLFLYIPAVIRCLGFSLLEAYKIFIILVNFCSLLAFYFAAKEISRNETCGILSALVAAFTVFRLIDMYGRAAVGEIQTFVFAPFIILGLYEIYHDNTEKWYYFTFGFWGICNCHLISLSMAVAVTAVVVLIEIKKMIRNRAIFFAFLKSVFVVVCLMIVFVGPMLEQLSVGNLVINILTSAKTGRISKKLMVPLDHLFYFFHTWRDPSFKSNNAYPGLLFLFIPFLRLPQIKKRSDALRCADIMTIISVVLIFASTTLFPWNYFQWFLNRIQYSWRLLLPVSMLLPISGAIYITSLCEGRKNGKIIYALFCAAAIICGAPIVYETLSSRMISRDLFWMQNNRVSGGEYKPVGLDIEYIDKNKDTVRMDNEAARITAHDRKGLTFTFSWISPENEEVSFEVPLIDYIGYQAEQTLPEGSIVTIPVLRAENGLVSVSNHGYNRGTIHVHFEKTVIQKISEGISGLSYLAVLLFAVWRKKKPGNMGREG